MDMARKFYETTPYHGVVDYDDSKMSDVIISLLENPTERIAILAIDDKTGEPVGMLCGQVGETLFNRKRVASELAWWIDPDHRSSRVSIELINAFEYWAKHKARCEYVQLATVETDQVERISKFYNRKNYNIYERCFLKVIN
jgi:GNAT superfamily N-acetyltransferase